MRACWGNASHTARGGVDNYHNAPAARGTNLALRARDHIERAQAHDRRSPSTALCFATGGGGACGSRLETGTAPRFATTNARRETNALSNSNAPRALRSGAFTMQ